MPKNHTLFLKGKGELTRYLAGGYKVIADYSVSEGVIK